MIKTWQDAAVDCSSSHIPEVIIMPVSSIDDHVALMELCMKKTADFDHYEPPLVEQGESETEVLDDRAAVRHDDEAVISIEAKVRHYKSCI